MWEKNIRFGCYLPFPTATSEKLIKVAEINEEAGFDSIWAPDHILFMPPGIVPEAWTILTAAAMVTKKVLLGTCVTDPHRYHPAVLAQRIATVDQVSAGRVIFGLGAGEAMNLKPFGIDWAKPVSKLVESVTIMRKLWSGESFSYEGKFWRLKDAFLQINPIQSKLPIYFAANSPRTLKLTGKMADGWVPNPMNPELYKKRLKLIEDGAKKAGRDIKEIDTAIYLYTSIADKAEDAQKQLEGYKPLIVTSPQILIEAGYEVEIPEEISSLSYAELLPSGEKIVKFARFEEFIPKEAVIDFSITGTLADCIEKIDEFVKAGVRHFILMNVGPNPRRVMEIYSKEIFPHFKGNPRC